MRKRRAVLFDDEPIVISLFRDFFLSKGYEVLAFAEPRVCPIYTSQQQSCSKQYPCADIVLTDFKMPLMNGLALLQAQEEGGCRLTARNKALLSGYLDPEKIRAVKRLGAAFFEKPVDLNDLEAWVRECEDRMDLTTPLGDRRRERRSPLPGMHCKINCSADLITCHAHDISPNGFCLRLPVPLEREQRVKVISDHAPSPRSAVVRWIARQSNGSYLTGLCCC